MVPTPWETKLGNTNPVSAMRLRLGISPSAIENRLSPDFAPSKRRLFLKNDKQYICRFIFNRCQPFAGNIGGQKIINIRTASRRYWRLIRKTVG